MEGNFDLDPRPCIYVEIHPVRAVLGSCMYGAPTPTRHATVVTSYGADDLAAVNAIMSEMKRQSRGPTVAVHGGVLNIVYSLPHAPSLCVREVSETIIFPGIPSTIGLHALTRTRLINDELPSPFVELHDRLKRFILLVTGPDNDLDEPLMLFDLPALHRW